MESIEAMDERIRCALRQWGVGLTDNGAARVRQWRVDERHSWRGVAAAASEAWGLNHGSNQLFGRDLCNAAARRLGEDPYNEPWN
jgi:hypothetical protein